MPKGLTLRALVPNAITAAALCVGLTGVRFAIAGDFERAVLAVIVAGVLDGLDGRAARMLNAQTKFGAELDSLADSISFGVVPALIIYLWTLQTLPSLGWIAALAFAICCVLRLARYNAQIDTTELPHKKAGFLTGVPAPVGAGLAFLPLYLWLVAGRAPWVMPDALGGWVIDFRSPHFITGWLLLIAFLLISNLPTLSWSRLRPPPKIRIEVIAIVGLLVAALFTETWLTLAGITLVYLLLIPVGLVIYAKVRRQRAGRDRQMEASSDE